MRWHALQVGAEVVVNNNEPISPSDMVDHFTKAKGRHQFAALLVAELIDEETRMRSNVRGKAGKEMLDPAIIEYVLKTLLKYLINALYFRWVKTKCFQYHPTAEANKKEEWERCIHAIDGKNRGIKRRTKKSQS